MLADENLIIEVRIKQLNGKWKNLFMKLHLSTNSTNHIDTLTALFGWNFLKQVYLEHLRLIVLKFWHYSLKIDFLLALICYALDWSTLRGINEGFSVSVWSSLDHVAAWRVPFFILRCVFAFGFRLIEFFPALGFGFYFFVCQTRRFLPG